MTTITTGSRLHFGLFNAGNTDGPQFGGLGMMIHEPRVRVSVRPSGEWIASGPECERALAAVRKVAGEPSFEVIVEACPPLHSGLGVGTQLAMAAGRAVAQELGLELSNESLAKTVGRGLRSGIGVRGFESGGFLLDHGHAGNEIPSVDQFDWPEDWCILLVRPQLQPVWHGSAELRSFARPRNRAESVEQPLRTLAPDVTDALRRQDLQAFGECLHRYNRLAGEAFAEDQGGNYSSATVADIVAWFRAGGICGVGQSSWGPTVFAVVDRSTAAGWRDAAAKHFRETADVSLTGGANSGFRIETA